MPKFRAASLQLSFTDLPRPKEADPFSGKFDLKAAEDYTAKRLERYLEFYDKAASETDLVLASEDLKSTGFYAAFLEDRSIFRRFAEPVPGPLFEELAGIARRRNAYIAACYVELDPGDENCYNTLSIISPNGKLAGKYRKVQLPAGETWNMTPGDSIEPIKTELGMLGGVICYDIMFPEVSRVLALRGADVLLHPTLGYGWWEHIGEITARCRAIDNSVYVIVSRDCHGFQGGRSQIIGPNGFILADAGRGENTWASAEIETPADWSQPASHFASVMTGIQSIRERWTRERRADLFGFLGEKDVPLLRRYPERDIPKTDEEFEEIYKKTGEHYRRCAAGKTSSLHW